MISLWMHIEITLRQLRQNLVCIIWYRVGLTQSSQRSPTPVQKYHIKNTSSMEVLKPSAPLKSPQIPLARVKLA